MWARSFGRSYTNLPLHTFRLHPQVNFVQKLSITCRLDYSYGLILNRWWLCSCLIIPSCCSLRVISENLRGPLPCFPSCPWNFESRDEILFKGGRMWRPRFLISIISANDRISQVKPVKPRSTWVITPKTSPMNPNEPLDQAYTHP
jgi:hypothetical protein